MPKPDSIEGAVSLLLGLGVLAAMIVGAFDMSRHRCAARWGEHAGYSLLGGCMMQTSAGDGQVAP